MPGTAIPRTAGLSARSSSNVFLWNMTFDYVIAHEGRMAARQFGRDTRLGSSLVEIWIILHRHLKSALPHESRPFLAAAATRIAIGQNRWLARSKCRACGGRKKHAASTL